MGLACSSLSVSGAAIESAPGDEWGQVFFKAYIGPIYTGDISSVWGELGQRTVARLIICMCINTGKQTDHPS